MVAKAWRNGAYGARKVTVTVKSPVAAIVAMLPKPNRLYAGKRGLRINPAVKSTSAAVTGVPSCQRAWGLRAN